MKAIYMSKYAYRLEQVYSKRMKEEFSKIFDIEDIVYNKENLKNSQDVEVILSTWDMPKYTEEEIKALFPKLKAIFYSAGSVQYFARPFLNLGIKVFSAWQANAVPVIDFAVSQILLATKGYFLLSSLAKKDYNSAREMMNLFPGNYEAKIGILGYGVIAKGAVKKLLPQSRIEIYVYAPDFSKEEADKLGIHKANTLDEIFTNCDVISNHIANLPSTLGIINKDLINKLHDYQTFINTGRGQQVDENALLEKCKNNPLITAVLDVTYPEPPLQDSLYFKLDNVFVSPHIAGSSGHEVIRMAEFMLEEAKHYLNNEKCKYEVTLKMLETMA